MSEIGISCLAWIYLFQGISTGLFKSVQATEPPITQGGRSAYVHWLAQFISTRMLHHSPTKPSMRQGQRNVLISELHQPSGPNMSWYGICPHLMVTLFSSCTAQAEGNKNVRAFNIRSRISSGSFSSRTHRGRVTHVKRSALLDGRRAERRARRCQHMPVLGFWGAVAHGYVRIADSCRKGGKSAGHAGGEHARHKLFPASLVFIILGIIPAHLLCDHSGYLVQLSSRLSAPMRTQGRCRSVAQSGPPYPAGQ